MSLFGIDVIINNQTGQHAVIDINAFPGECFSTAFVCDASQIMSLLQYTTYWFFFRWQNAGYAFVQMLALFFFFFKVIYQTKPQEANEILWFVSVCFVPIKSSKRNIILLYQGIARLTIHVLNSLLLLLLNIIIIFAFFMEDKAASRTIYPQTMSQAPYVF